DRLDARLFPVANRDTHAVAPNEAAALVGDNVSDLCRVQRAMDLSAERFELGPDLFLPSEPAVARVAEVTRGVPGDLDHVCDEVLRVHPGFLEHFEDADGLVVLVKDRSKGEGELGRIAGVRVPVGPLFGAENAGLAFVEGEPEEFGVGGP